MSTELRKGFKRISTNYLRLGSTLGLGILEVPLLFYWLGNNGFGLVSMLGPTIGFAAVVTEIVNVSLIRELGSVYHTGDRDRFRNTYHASIRIAAIATAITGVLTVALVLLLPLLNIEDSLVPAAQIFAGAGGVYAMTRVAFAPTISLFVIKEQFVANNTLLVLYRVVFLLVAICLFFVLGRGMTGASIAMYGLWAFGINAMVLVGVSVTVWLRNAELNPSLSEAVHADTSGIVSSFGWNTAVILAISLADRAPQLIINIFFGTSVNAIYGVAFRLGAYARMITIGLTDGLESVTTRISSEENRQDRLRRFLKISTRVHAAVALPAAVTLAMLADPLLTHWIARTIDNPQVMIPKAVPVAQLFVVGMVVRGIGEGWVRILYGDGHVRKYAPVLITAALLLPGAVLLAAKYAPESLSLTFPALAFAAVWLIAYGVFIPFVGKQPLGVHLREFYLPVVRPALLATLTAGALVLGNRVFGPYSLVELGLTMAGTAGLVGAVAFAAVLTREERARLLRAAGRFIPRSGPVSNPPE